MKTRTWLTGLPAAALVAAAFLSGPPALAGEEGEAIMLKPGDTAPGFSLVGSDGLTYSLDDLKGEAPVVIAWFPKAFTGG